MTIGVAIIVVAVMYFIDKHNLWRRFTMGLGIVIVLALLGLGGFWGWTTYRDARDKRALVEFNKKWAAEIPTCNARNIKMIYFGVAQWPPPEDAPWAKPEQSIPQSTMDEIKKNCTADPYTYVRRTGLEILGEECLDGTNDPCMLVSDGHGNLVPIPKGQAKDDAKKASK